MINSLLDKTLQIGFGIAKRALSMLQQSLKCKILHVKKTSTK